MTWGEVTHLPASGDVVHAGLESIPRPRAHDETPGLDYAAPSWAGWAVCPHVFVVTRRVGVGDYDLDLDEMATPAKAWEWLQHTARKQWATEPVMAGMWAAINDALGGRSWVAGETTLEQRQETISGLYRRGLERVTCYREAD